MTTRIHLSRSAFGAALLATVIASVGCGDGDGTKAGTGGTGGAATGGAGGGTGGSGGGGGQSTGGSGGGAGGSGVDAGTPDGAMPSADATPADTAPTPALDDPANYNPGFTMTAPNKPGSIQVTFSGETLGSEGLPFPPTADGEPFFVDGWSVEFEVIIGVVGNIRLSPNALKYPDQKQLDPAIATKAGPFVLDFAKPGSLKATDGESPAGGVFLWDKADNGSALDTSMRYAFSYDMVPARYPATNVNVPKAYFGDYDLMVKNGWTKFIRGKATYTGKGTHPDAEAQKRFAMLPKTVFFTFGWSDAGGLVNCINPDLDQGGTGEPGEKLANRGVQPVSSGATYAQITLHIDHIFWDAVKIEGTPLRFDHIAAWAPATTTKDTAVSINTLKKPLAVTFADGYKLPDRGEYQGIMDYKTNQMDKAQIVLDRNGVPAVNLPDIPNFMAFSAQSMMHMNADGLCYVVGQQSADPFYKPGL